MGERTRCKKDGGGTAAVQVGEASIGASGDGNESAMAWGRGMVERQVGA